MNQKIIVITSLLLILVGMANSKSMFKFVEGDKKGPQITENDRNFFYPVYTAFRISRPFSAQDDIRKWMARRDNLI